MKFKIFLIIFLAAIACTDDNDVTRPYPDVETIVTDVGEYGATFEARISNYTGSEPEKGFIWYRTEGLVERRSVSGAFSIKVTSTLASAAAYYVKAYIVVNGTTIYGNRVRFDSKGSSGPEDVEFSPKAARAYDTISITGKGFSSIAGVNVVRFDGITAKVVYVSENLLKVIVPDLMENNNSFHLTVTTAGIVAPAGIFTLQLPPPITADKTSVKLCETLTITALALPPEGIDANYVIYFNNTPGIPYLRDGNMLKVNVPSLPQGTTDMNVKLVVGNQQRLLSGIITLRQFKINSFSPVSFTALSTITVFAQNVPACGLNAKIDGQVVALQNVSDTQFEFVVPAGVNGAFELQLFMYLNHLQSYTFDK